MAGMRVVRSVDTVSSTARTLGSRQLAAQVTAITGPHPGYRALAQGVRTLLLDGRIPLHTRLPAERELATALEVSRATITAAYDLLREGGYALSRRGSGTWTELPEGAAPANVARYQAPDGVIDLAMAAPSAPAAELAAAFELAGPELACHATTNGYHPLGLPELRAAVAERYTRRGLPTLPEQILITTGAQSAVSLVVNLLGRPGDRALVESPSYPNALDAVRHAGLRITPVPVTEDGWDIELLECTLRQTAPRLAYLIPDFQNPTGALMSAEQRARLLRAARAPAPGCSSTRPWPRWPWRGRRPRRSRRSPTGASRSRSSRSARSARPIGAGCASAGCGRAPGSSTNWPRCASTWTWRPHSSTRCSPRRCCPAWTTSCSPGCPSCASGATRWPTRWPAISPSGAGSCRPAGSASGSTSAARSPGRWPRRPWPTA